MDIRNIGVVDLSIKRLDYLERQQSITARNVANADTPGYRALRMKPFSEVLSSSSKAYAPVRTHPMHLSGTSKTAEAGVVADRAAPMSPNGNNVVLEEQMATAAENAANHNLATSVYKKAVSLITLPMK